MVNYKEMYGILFNKMTDIIEELQQAQRQTEEIYLNSKESDFVTLNSGKDSEQMIPSE